MPTNWIDFKELRERISLEEVMFRYYKLDPAAFSPCLRRWREPAIESCTSVTD